MITASLIESIKLGEGKRLKPYKCPAGKLSIGYGRNLDDVGITDEEAEYLLINDIKRAEKDAEKLSCYKKLNQNRKEVIIEMVFNMGLPRVLGFKKMLAALDAGNYSEAANQALDSKWARDVGERAKRLAYFLRVG